MSQFFLVFHFSAQLGNCFWPEVTGQDIQPPQAVHGHLRIKGESLCQLTCTPFTAHLLVWFKLIREGQVDAAN